jgi:hypothetical protein
MNIGTVRRRCEARLRHISIPIPFDIAIFTDAIANRRGRPIALQPIRQSGEVSGAWVSMHSVDIVFFEERTSPLHRLHIIVHELSHVLCDHHGIALDIDGLQSLLRSPAPVKRLRALQRTQYSDEEEQEAEILATLILEYANHAQANIATGDPHIAGTLRLLDNLEGMPS